MSNPDLEQNRQRLHHSLAVRIHELESKYRMKSPTMERRVKTGKLRETPEITQWLIVYRTYKNLEPEREQAQQ